MLQQPSKPITIPGQLDTTISYREIIKQLAAQQTTKPYGDIPPMLNKRHKKKRPKSARKEPQEPMRRMSHVEDWIVVDSKESLPDEEELVRRKKKKSFFWGYDDSKNIIGTVSIKEFFICRFLHTSITITYATTFLK